MGKKKLVGNDKIGKLIRLNQKTLDVNAKGYAEVVFWGDVHLGHPQCKEEKAKAMLDYCLKHHIYVMLMGDYLESGQKTSIGDSVYQQRLSPQEQMEEMVEMLKPLADAGLILGMHSGNHEERITITTGVDVTKVMARLLGVSYLGYACWSLLRVGDQTYSTYTYHGKSGSRFKHTKLKAAIDISHYFQADIIAMGHVHDIDVDTIMRQRVNRRNKTVEERKVHIILTGSYIAYDKSYAQMAGYPPAKLGSPKMKLFGDRRDIHTSV